MANKWQGMCSTTYLTSVSSSSTYSWGTSTTTTQITSTTIPRNGRKCLPCSEHTSKPTRRIFNKIRRLSTTSSSVYRPSANLNCNCNFSSLWTTSNLYSITNFTTSKKQLPSHAGALSNYSSCITATNSTGVTLNPCSLSYQNCTASTNKNSKEGPLRTRSTRTGHA